MCNKVHPEGWEMFSSRGFPGGAVVKNLPANIGDTGEESSLKPFNVKGYETVHSRNKRNARVFEQGI